MNNIKNDLQIIKEGKEGHGLLIENDGFVQLDKSMLKENMNGEWHCPYPFIVNAVFQKSDTKNANGRIYPDNILRREVEKYQQKIKEHRALGECYTPDAECLTENGWKKITDVKEGDNILTLNPTTNKFEYQEVTFKTETDWNGKMISIKGGSTIDDIVTPNHGFPIYKFNEEKLEWEFDKFMTASELMLNYHKKTVWLPLRKDNLRTFVDLSGVQYKEINYEGKVYCVEVPNHIWYVKQNGRAHWTKNCNHPSDSTIDLGRISHNIIELHWEGKTVVGKMEINVSQGFVKQGICSTFGDTIANLLLNGYKIGVSSRAVGSVENRLGVMMVGDDLELICWDVVSDPSTPGAWIGNEQELTQYIENKQTTSNLTEKIERLKNIL